MRAICRRSMDGTSIPKRSSRPVRGGIPPRFRIWHLRLHPCVCLVSQFLIYAAFSATISPISALAAAVDDAGFCPVTT